ncbi:ead/Ea22-like family protein [Escherichia coli]|uniref:ead/Ea22-like family protein n=1 Tax=Escherichia coli TaxID=562 RepID=UPI00193AA602|nr:ead/Ea22-like family protein [Escherichia coli]EIU9436556.1 ead/Ea22-like family protein [Escherichia coli]EKW6777815.1 ead/Ea22-like family protein [Escherichia coli]ELL0326640.1 ead/Ea22-like family protein [Escherichia coli]MBM1008191.1 ead/Ea22-like family protein [Escherichia coli]MDF2097888.1 ead/Ea22-like family protein [Escherichia coli]
MSEIDYQALREAAERAIPAMERLLMLPVDDDLISEQELKDYGVDIDALNAFKLLAGPETVLELLNEIKRQEDTNIDSICRIAELEAREIKPAKGEVLVVVSGFTGCGKSAIAGEIEIAMKAIGVPVQWTNGDAEKRMTGADWLTAIEMYKPTVRIVEVNVPRAAGIRIKGDAGEQNDEKP